jgi:cold shock CspA family protein
MARGSIRAFDSHAGVGEIEDDEGRALPFHCTALTDGSRSISVGADVEFEVAPSHRGRWEAARVSRV